MTHIHEVKDTDVHYKIDGVTRTITNINETKRTLVQNDHNSERLTFEMPRHFDSHDFSQCNRVQVHYLNSDTYEKGSSDGIYEVDDLHISSEDEKMVIFSWLVSGNATKYVGTLNFTIRFACVADDGTVEYAWNTTTFKGITILPGIYNSDKVAAEYADILEQWRKSIISSACVKHIITGYEIDGTEEDAMEGKLPAYMYDGSIASFRQDGNALYDNAPFSSALIFTLAKYILGKEEAVLGDLTFTQVAISSYGEGNSFIWARNISEVEYHPIHKPWTMILSTALDNEEGSLAGEIAVDIELDENSDNAIANSTVTKALNEKANKSDFAEEGSFKWTDFEADVGENVIPSDCIYESAISVVDPVTIKCAGNTLGFTVTLTGDAETATITMNGQAQTYSNGETVTIPMTFMGSDITFEGVFSYWEFTDMVCTKSNLLTAEEAQMLIDVAVNAALANFGNKTYNVTISGYYEDESFTTVNTESWQGTLIIDSMGNFNLDVGNLDYMAGYNCRGLWVDGLEEVITNFGLTTSTWCTAVFSYADSGLMSAPEAFGCRIGLGVNEASQLNVHFSQDKSMMSDMPIGVWAAVNGKLY